VSPQHDEVVTPMRRSRNRTHDPALLFPDTTGLEEQEREKRRQLMEKFQKAPFEEIAAHCESKVVNQC